MVSPLFTAFALIAAGRAEVPPPPAQAVPAPEIRGIIRAKDAEPDRIRRRAS